MRKLNARPQIQKDIIRNVMALISIIRIRMIWLCCRRWALNASEPAFPGHVFFQMGMKQSQMKQA